MLISLAGGFDEAEEGICCNHRGLLWTSQGTLKWNYLDQIHEQLKHLSTFTHTHNSILKQKDQRFAGVLGVCVCIYLILLINRLKNQRDFPSQLWTHQSHTQYKQTARRHNRKLLNMFSHLMPQQQDYIIRRRPLKPLQVTITNMIHITCAYLHTYLFILWRLFIEFSAVK